MRSDYLIKLAPVARAGITQPRTILVEDSVGGIIARSRNRSSHLHVLLLTFHPFLLFTINPELRLRTWLP